MVIPSWWDEFAFECCEFEIYIAGVCVGVFTDFWADVLYDPNNPDDYKIIDVTIGENGKSIKQELGYDFIVQQIEGRFESEIQAAALEHSDPEDTREDERRSDLDRGC
jgi:hypothetical protein